MSTVATPSRAALARAALHRAERDLGVRRPAPRPGAGPLGSGSRATAPEPSVRPAAPAPAAPGTEQGWPVHERLAPLLPGGVLHPGSTVAVAGSAGLLLALLAGPSRAGAWAAVVGYPALGLLAAADAGVDLDRVALVPEPGPDAATVVAALVDGVDVVVVGPRAALADADRRRLTARARERSAVLLAAGPWVGARVQLTARAGSWEGLGRGAGWLRWRTLLVERTGRAAAARPLRAEIEVPLGADPLAELAGRPAPVGAGLPAATPIDRPAGTDADAPVPRGPTSGGLRLVG